MGRRRPVRTSLLPLGARIPLEHIPVKLSGFETLGPHLEIRFAAPETASPSVSAADFVADIPGTRVREAVRFEALLDAAFYARYLPLQCTAGSLEADRPEAHWKLQVLANATTDFLSGRALIPDLCQLLESIAATSIQRYFLVSLSTRFRTVGRDIEYLFAEGWRIIAKSAKRAVAFSRTDLAL